MPQRVPHKPCSVVGGGLEPQRRDPKRATLVSTKFMCFFLPLAWFRTAGSTFVQLPFNTSWQQCRSMRHKSKVTEHQGGRFRTILQRTPWGGGKKRGVENLTNDTPPKKGFWTPPSYGSFSTPQVSVLCFSSHDRADQNLFWRGPKMFGKARFLVGFPPPIRCAPPPYHGPNSSTPSPQVF